MPVRYFTLPVLAILKLWLPAHWIKYLAEVSIRTKLSEWGLKFGRELRLEESSGHLLFSLQHKAGPALISHSVTQGLVQLDLKTPQGWGLNNLFEQPVQLLVCSFEENVFPYTQLVCLLVSIYANASHPSVITVKEPGSVFFWWPLCRCCGSAVRSPQSCLFSRLNKPTSLSLSW